MTDALQYLLDYYKVRRPWDINVVHRVNDRERFESYLNDSDVHMFEIDIEDIDDTIEDIVFKHEGIGDVSFTWAREQLTKHKKALKLDFKKPSGKQYIPEFYEYVFGILHECWDPKIPLWIHADILKGPNWRNSNHESLDSVNFIQLYNDYHRDNSNTMLSLGYLTSYRDDTTIQHYTPQMLQEMKRIVDGVDGSVTISLRYINLLEKIGIIHEFLKFGSVTIWNWEDKISQEGFTELEGYVRKLKVFKDLTGKDGKPIWN